jgi:hypothetical protein
MVFDHRTFQETKGVDEKLSVELAKIGILGERYGPVLPQVMGCDCPAIFAESGLKPLRVLISCPGYLDPTRGNAIPAYHEVRRINVDQATLDVV